MFHPLIPGLPIPRSKDPVKPSKGLLAKKEFGALCGLLEFKKSDVSWTLQLLSSNLTDLNLDVLMDIGCKSVPCYYG